MTMADIGTFELLSWSWGTTNSGGSGSGGGPGKANVNDLGATKAADQHTPKLMQYAASGQRTSTVELRTTKGGDVFVIRLEDVLVSSFQTGDGSRGDAPTDTFGLTFAEMEYEFSEEKGKK